MNFFTVDTSAPDFIRKETTVIFPVSGISKQTESVNVDIVDDGIFEEDESFLVVLDVEDAHKSDTVKFTRNPILCEIRNDDGKAYMHSHKNYSLLP